jgi:tRNA threonylcarbamoyladenosine biosynthesis protein TsaB
MKLLAIDCSANLCAACVYDADADAELGRAVRDLGKGHAEHLMGVVGDAMEQAGTVYPDLGAIAVSVGPGSFTGVRVGVSAARGFALALGIPAIGVTTLEAIAAEARGESGAVAVMAGLDAGRGEIHAAIYDGSGLLLHGPAIVILHDAVELTKTFQPLLAGSAAKLIAQASPVELQTGPSDATADIAIYARLAAAKGSGAEKPKPLYLRQADAKPQAGFVLPRTGA